MPKPKRRAKRNNPEHERDTRDLLACIVEVLPVEELPELFSRASELLDKHVPRLERLPEAQLADMEAVARQHGFVVIADKIFEERNRTHSSRRTRGLGQSRPGRTTSLSHVAYHRKGQPDLQLES